MILRKTLPACALTACMLFASIAAAQQSGSTSGPATGTNVAPSKGVTAGGAAGVPGQPGNKNGPAPDKQATGQEQTKDMKGMTGNCKTESAKMTEGQTVNCK